MASLLLAIIYLAFISLGLPDTLLGAGWPTMYPDLNVPVSYAGIISMTIAFGTIVSALNSDRLTRRFGAGKVTAVSVAMTCVALFGFSVSHSFWMLVLWAIPYGLGAGGVDAALNNYVALHYSSRSMSWLHCMWGLGAAISPYIMSFCLGRNLGWNSGYRFVSILQVVLTAILFVSLPLWKTPEQALVNQNDGETASDPSKAAADSSSDSAKAMKISEILAIPGAKEVLFAFFCYCALEQSSMLWAASYLNLRLGMPAESAASFGGMFCIGITVGRAVNGFLTMKFSDDQLIRMGSAIIGIGALLIFVPFLPCALAGFILIGLGCAPVYPCIIHSTPANFGAERSQAIIGVQMAFAYIGILVMPPLFGVIASRISISLLPVYILAILALMVYLYESMLKKIGK